MSDEQFAQLIAILETLVTYVDESRGILETQQQTLDALAACCAAQTALLELIESNTAKGGPKK